MKKERYAVGLIMVAFFSGMLLTAATSGCDSRNNVTQSTAQASDTETVTP